MLEEVIRDPKQIKTKKEMTGYFKRNTEEKALINFEHHLRFEKKNEMNVLCASFALNFGSLYESYAVEVIE